METRVARRGWRASWLKFCTQGGGQALSPPQDKKTSYQHILLVILVSMLFPSKLLEMEHKTRHSAETCSVATLMITLIIQ